LDYYKFTIGSTIEESDLTILGDTFLIHVDLNPKISTDLALGEDLTWNFTGLTIDESNYVCHSKNDGLEFVTFVKKKS